MITTKPWTRFLTYLMYVCCSRNRLCASLISSLPIPARACVVAEDEVLRAGNRCPPLGPWGSRSPSVIVLNAVRPLASEFNICHLDLDNRQCRSIVYSCGCITRLKCRGAPDGQIGRDEVTGPAWRDLHGEDVHGEIGLRLSRRKRSGGEGSRVRGKLLRWLDCTG